MTSQTGRRDDVASDHVPPLPSPLTEPMIFLSKQQRDLDIVRGMPNAEPPCWVPARLIADALGWDHSGIEAAVASLGGRPYVWATELENVHALWNYEEPGFQVDGLPYEDAEHYFHCMKKPFKTGAGFDSAGWDRERDAVMRRALRLKWEHAPDGILENLLRASGEHPLLSLKADAYWGFDPRAGRGENRLAMLWEEMRGELVPRGH